MPTPPPSETPDSRISLDEVRHVAELARLAMSDEELESCRGELASILGHIATIDAIDVDGLVQIVNYGKISGLGAEGYHDGEPNVSEAIAIGGGEAGNGTKEKTTIDELPFANGSDVMVKTPPGSECQRCS